MQSFFSLILVVLGGWAAAGAVTTFIGKSDNITEGMKKVGRAVVDWWSSSTPPPQSLILEWQISGLTQSIEIFLILYFL